MESNKFDSNNPFFAFMGGLADVAIVNILLILCSLPVVTAGASMAAKYAALRKMQEGSMNSALRCFFWEFQACLKNSLSAWLAQFLTGCLLIFDLMFVTRAENHWFWHIIGMVLGCLFLLWMMVSSYLFPAAVYKGRTVREAVRESFLLAVRNLPYTLVMMIVNAIPALCFWFGGFFLALAVPVYLVAGFGAGAYLNTMLMRRCTGMAGES